MNNDFFIKNIQINNFSSTPKYIQLVDAVIDGIKRNFLTKGDVLPSINELSFYLDVSRDTVEKGYNQLKNQGVISSAPGKSYFVATTDVLKKQKIALFLNKLSAHKKIVYDAFAKELGDQGSLDLFVYNSDISHLRRLLLNLTKDYDRYVVFPHFKEGRDRALEVLSLIPVEKLLLLGRHIEGISAGVDAVYENYEKDIYEALEEFIEPLARYKILKLVFPDNSDYPKAIIKGFYKICNQYAFEHVLVGNLKKVFIKSGDCYITLTEDDLKVVLEKSIKKNLIIGTDVGVISYNETPLKKFILNGITTISTDFELMGKYAAQLIVNNEKKQVAIPFYATIRPSI